MNKEASRVVEERAAAKAAGDKMPHAARAAGCEAFLKMNATARLSLLKRIRIQQESVTIGQIPTNVAKRLHIIPQVQRAQVAEHLLAWWDQQVVYTLCGKRELCFPLFQSPVIATLGFDEFASVWILVDLDLADKVFGRHRLSGRTAR